VSPYYCCHALSAMRLLRQKAVAPDCEFVWRRYVILFFYPLDFTFVCPTGTLPARGAQRLPCFGSLQHLHMVMWHGRAGCSAYHGSPVV